MRSPFTRTGLAAATVATALAAGLTATVTLSAAGAPVRARPSTAAAPERGSVLWAEPLRSLTAEQARAALGQGDFDADAVRNGVAEYRLVYRTVDPHGAPTTGSGLIALPRTAARSLRLVSFTHGTTSYREDAPSSVPPGEFSAGPATEYAAAGFAATAPDYLGLGVGPGPHPYFDIRSETTATLDLARAARRFVATRGRTLERGIDITGFSQGASAALALARTLQRGGDPYFRVHALAGVSGGYDFRHAELPAMLHGRIAGPVAVPYVAYLFVALHRLYPIYRDPAEVFRAPYATRVDTLFNGSVPGPQMQAALPTSLAALLTPHGLRLLAHPSGGLAAALEPIDDVCSWRTAAPTRLYYARGDEQAVTANTASCRRTLAAHGRAVPAIDLGPRDYARSRHLGSSVAGATATLRWFRALR